jgi:hypothetical protein
MYMGVCTTVYSFFFLNGTINSLHHYCVKLIAITEYYIHAAIRLSMF